MDKTEVATHPQTSEARCPAFNPETVAALRTAGDLFTIARLWETTLHASVFPLTTITDGKSRVEFQKRLATFEAMSVLALLWQRGGTVAPGDLIAAGLDPVDVRDKPLTCHSLAEDLAPDQWGVGRQEKRLQKIAAAAAAYGLITNDPIGNMRGRPMRATHLLHELMLHMHHEMERIGRADPCQTETIE